MNSRPFLRELLWLPIVALALLAIYLPGLDNQPVFDDAYLADGELFGEYASLGVRTRMLSYGSFVWLQALVGDGWWKQRLFNLALHFGVVLALWGLYRETLRHVAAPPEPDGTPAPPYEHSPALGFAIAFFALNPVGVYAVAYLIQRSIVMATLFVVLGLWAFAAALARRSLLLHAAALACYVLAVMSKEHAILAPLAALPFYVLVARPDRRRLAVLGGAVLVVAGIAGVVLWQRFGDIIAAPFDEYSRVYLAQLSRLQPGAELRAYPLSVLNEAYLFFHYALRWLVPVGEWMSINLRPPFPVSLASFPQVLGALGYVALLGLGGWLLVRLRDGRGFLGLCLLVPALLYGTEFATVWVQDPFVLYRSYLWAIAIPGIVFFLVAGAPPRVLIVAALVAGPLLTWQAMDRVISLSTPERAWSDAIDKLSDDPRAVGRWFPYLNRGVAYVEGSQFNLAERDFEASAALGDMGMGRFNLGAVLAATGRHAQALRAFDQAEKEGYALYNLPLQRGLSLMNLGRIPEAYAELRKAHVANPPSPAREVMLLHLGRLAMQLGKPFEAVPYLQELAARSPQDDEAKRLLATSYVMVGAAQQARDLLDPMIERAPSGRLFYLRALANYALRRKAEALGDIERAVAAMPAEPGIRQWQEKIRAMP